MLFFRNIFFLALVASLLSSEIAFSKACLLTKKDLDLEVDFWGIFKPESFTGKNFTFLNNNVPADKTFYFRHTNDFFVDMNYGRERFGHPVAQFKSSVRNRAVWGSPSSIANTLATEAPLLDATTKEHHHAFPRLFFWMREAWLKLSLAEFLHLDLQNKHNLTLGAFPFELGRGIALGSAYAIGAGPLGFYSDSMIDQFAFGLKLSGDIVEQALTYDLYGAILQSRSNSLSETAKPIFKNEIGRRDNPARGFGHDSYLVAARLNWTAFKNDIWGELMVEPYVLYNNDPEQKVEFVADASSKLATAGFAVEYVGKKFEGGFDTAFNMGNQYVRPWDRNYIVTENYNGQIVLVNNNVIIASDNAFNGLKAPHVPKSNGQKLINTSGQTGQSNQNGLEIEGANNLAKLGYANGPLSLVNSDKRFRTGPDGNGYKNIYKGYMLVGDASYWLYKRELQLAVTAGFASGDQDPNNSIRDGDYSGFIGLQEVYAGKRVKSVFLLGTVGKVKRPGTAPENPLASHDFAVANSGFTNLIFVGSGFTWKPASCNESKFVVNPNVFAYWEDSPGKKFDPFTRKDLPHNASSYLGTEVNTFISYYPFSSLKCFAIGSIFLPGKHFKDIKGKPLNAEENRLLERLDAKGLNPHLIPNIGDDIAYTINVGMEFAF